MTGTLAFDLDGTLITCAPRQTTVMRAVLGHRSVNWSAWWEAKRAGANSADSLSAQGLSTVESQQAMARWLRSIEEPIWLQLDTVFAGVGSLLASLRHDGFHLLLLTARSRPEWVRPQLARLGLLKMFDEIVVVSPFKATHQKSQVLRRASAQIYIGDTESDAAAAEIANCPSAIVSTGQRSKIFLREHQSAPVYDTLQDALGAAQPVLGRMGATYA